MIFTYALADAIKDGRKTVTRRPVVTGEPGKWRRFNPPKRGELLPIQRGYNKAAFSVLVTGLTLERGFQPDFQDDAEGRREGFKNGEAFWLEWHAIYGYEPVDVYRIEFEPPTPVAEKEGE